MGGFGSGRRNTSSLGRIEGHRSIDLVRLRQEGCLRVGWQGTWRWLRNGDLIASVSLRAEPDGFQVSDMTRLAGASWADASSKIWVAHHPCRYGGSRPYFICKGAAGAACDRRVLKLYQAERGFICRHCCGLTYRSQSEDLLGRARRRAWKGWARLGGEDISVAHHKPKGMWHQKFKRLVDRAISAEMLADEEFERRAALLETCIK